MSQGRGIQKIFTIYLDSARDGERIEVLGRYVQISDSSNPSAEINVAVQDNIGASKYHRLVRTGEIVESQGFSRLYLKNDAQAGEWVKMIVTDGPEDFSVKAGDFGTISGITNTVTVEEAAHGSIKTAAKVTVTNAAAAAVVLAANTSRVEAIITNIGTDEVYLGDSDVSATNSRGLPLLAGEKIILTVSGAIYGHNNSGSDQDLAISWTE